MTYTGPIIDSHIHLWSLDRFRYTWIDGNELLERDYLPHDFAAAIDGLPVEKLIFMQAAALPEQAVDEARWAHELHAADPRVACVIADAPLEDPRRSGPALDELRELPLVRGIRRLIQTEGDPAEFCRNASFVNGVRKLPDYGFSFDICVNWRTLPAVNELIENCPDVAFVLDHHGNPDTTHGELDPWREYITRIAAHENVSCKISGLLTLADPAWTPAGLIPYIEHVVESFGYDRVMFGSDWPVILRTGTYREWFDTVCGALESATDEQLHAVFYGNAERIYRLNG